MSTLPIIGATSHASGGRDRWTEGLPVAPSDPVAATWQVLKEVLDPELPISIVDLGLVYDLRCEGPSDAVRVGIDLTYTATACPCQEFIREDIRDRLDRESWVASVQIDETWDPPWTSDRISSDGRSILREFGVTA